MHRRHVGPDGSRIQLPTLPGGQTYLSVASYGDGLLVSRTATAVELDGRGQAVAIQLDGEGREMASWICDGLAGDAGSGAVLWHEPGVGVHVGMLATGRDRRLAVRGATPLALLGRKLVATTPRGRPVLFTLSGERAPLSPGLELLDDLEAVAEETGRLYGHRAGHAFDEHSAVLEAATGDLAWTSDRWSVRGVSRGGEYAWAFSSATGGDPDAMAVLDAATGSELAELPLLSPERSLGESGAAFEPDGSLLVQVYNATRTGLTWTVVRVRLDGRVERVLPVLGTEGYEPPFAFDLVAGP